MRIFNIQTYGDFDVPSTALLMAAPEGMSKKVAGNIVAEIEEMFGDTDDAIAVKEYLLDWGFTMVKQHRATIGGKL